MKADVVEQSLYEVRKAIHPRAVHGWFAAWRWFLVWGTQLVFYGTAWLQWNDRQAGRAQPVNATPPPVYRLAP